MTSRWTLIVCAALIAAPLAVGAETDYTVRKGDTLSRIARWAGITTEALKEANGLESNRLKPGMKLKIPSDSPESEIQAPSAESSSEPSSPKEKVEPPAPAAAAASHPQIQVRTPKKAETQVSTVQKGETQIHTVQKGETLSGIAATYGMSVKELKKSNHIRKPRRLKPGMALIVRKPAPVPVHAGSRAETAAVPRTPPEKTEKMELAGITPVRETGQPGVPPSEGKLPAGSATGIRDKLVAIAKEMLDIPYRFGGRSLLGVDCSGFVQKVFSLLDIALPRTAREQFRLGKLIGRDDLSIGDLVFFRTYANFPSHVGIYLGDNRFIHASAKDRKVKVDSLDAPYYIKRFIGAKRLDLEEGEKGI